MHRKNYVETALDALNAGDVYTPIPERGSPTQKKLLRELEKLRVGMMKREMEETRIIEQNKLAIAGVAHDIKTPLALISGYAECMRDGMDDRDYLALISEKTEQMNGLVLNLVETSQHEMTEIPKLRDLVAAKMFFGGVLEKYEPLAKQKNITYRVKKIPAAKLYIDRRDIERVMQNVVTNAVKYTDEGGRITVSFAKKNAFLEIKIKDNGRGIDKKNLPFVFDKFFMEDSSRTDSKSSGLGLYVARNIVRKHGGEITVKSVKGKGTTFTVSIPEYGDPSTLTQRFEAQPKRVKVPVLFFFGFLLSPVFRIIRYFETQRIATLLTGILGLPLFVLLWPLDVACEALYNKMMFAVE